jgi:hypothetical protein
MTRGRAMMRTIEATGVVNADHTITLKLPEDFPEGDCHVLVSSDAKTPSLTDLPPLEMLDIGPWPKGFTVSREQIYGDDGR